LGILGLVLVGAGQALVLIWLLFEPDGPIDEPHWTDDVVAPYLPLTLFGGVFAIFGLLFDEDRDASWIALTGALACLVYPWGL
jgi:hypothetical protein